MSNIPDIIKHLAGRQEATLQICVVDSVDRAARTADCSPLNEGAPLLGCNLQACQDSQHGLIVYPKVGSYVLVGLLEGLSAGLVLLTDEVDEVEIKIGERSLQMTSEGIVCNGGQLGGLIKIEGLTSRLNAIEDDINRLKQTLSTWTPISSDGGAALKAAAASWSARPLAKTKRGDYENELIKH